MKSIPFVLWLCPILLLCGCARLGALPKEPGDNARVIHLWPLYKSIQDAGRDIRETQILWPFYKYRRVGADSFLRLWPIYLSAREENETFPFCTEYQCSSLSLFSLTESDDYRVYGIVSPVFLAYYQDDNVDAVSIYPLWWPNFPTAAIRSGPSRQTGLLVDIVREECKGYRLFNVYWRPGRAHGVVPLYGIHEDWWYVLGPFLTKLREDKFIRLLLVPTWPSPQGRSGEPVSNSSGQRP